MQVYYKYFILLAIKKEVVILWPLKKNKQTKSGKTKINQIPKSIIGISIEVCIYFSKRKRIWTNPKDQIKPNKDHVFKSCNNPFQP